MGCFVRLAIDVGDGYIEINNIKSKEFRLWEDSCLEAVNIRCVSSEGILSVYNIFGIGNFERQNVRTLMDSCGMLVTKKGNVYRYSCNDEGFQSDFDKMVFEIELL